MGGPPAWGLGEVVTTPRRKNVARCEMLTQKYSKEILVTVDKSI